MGAQGSPESVMAFVGSILRLMFRLGALARPSYHPERYYMRGPGPACARRMGLGGN